MGTRRGGQGRERCVRPVVKDIMAAPIVDMAVSRAVKRLEE